MSTVYLLLYSLIFLLCSIRVAKHQMHMFQLNSYKPKTHLHWIRRQAMGALCLGFVSAGAALWALTVPSTPMLAFVPALVLMIIDAWLYRTGEVKKPLVYTHRVLRMFVTMAVLAIVLIGAAVFAFQKQGVLPAAQSVLFALLPFLMLLANWVNTPIEAMVRQKYIGEAAQILRDADRLKIIGITGSYGKTSMKYFVTSLLRGQYDVLMTPGNYNTTLGVVKTIREQYSPTNEIFVCEMGARYVGDIEEICRLVHPHAGVITSIGEQHLETFGSLDNIKKTKYELANALADQSPLFLNGDDANVLSVPHKDSAILYGIDNHSGYYADDIRVSEKGTRFVLHTPTGEGEEISTPLLGRHNVLNLVGAAAVAHTFGVSLKTIALRARKLESVPHRLQLLRKPDGAIIDDAYNSNPAGAAAALEVLSMFDGLKILVTPGMVELGERQKACNYTFGEQAARVCDYIVLVGANQTKDIREGILHAGFDQSKLMVTERFSEAMQQVDAIPYQGKRYILLENDLPDNY